MSKILENYLVRTGPNNITFALLFDGPANQSDLVDFVFTLSSEHKRLRQRLVTTAFRFEWTEADDFDVHDHVEGLNLPNPLDDETIAEILSVARRLHLPTDRPRWRCILVNPKTDASSPAAGRSAMVLHLDHTLADGVRIAQMLDHGFRAKAAHGQDLASPYSRKIREVELASLRKAADESISALDLSVISIDRKSIRRQLPPGRSMTEWFLSVGQSLTDDPRLYKPGGWAGRRCILIRMQALHAATQMSNNHPVLA